MRQSRVRAGLGTTVAWTEAALSFVRARAALALAPAAGDGTALISARDRAGELLLGADPVLAAEFAAALLAPLASLSPGSRERLTATLAAWLDEQGRLGPAARRLGIHPQTARYRLARLRELFGDGLDDPISASGSSSGARATMRPDDSRVERHADQCAQRRLVLVVSFAIFLDTLFYAVITPLLPQLSHELHLSKLSAGVMTASYPAGMLVASLPGGALAVRRGPRFTVIAALVLLVISTVGFGLLERRRRFDIARFVEGVGGACSWAGGLAWIVAVTPAERRGAVMGSALGTSIAGALFGPAVGALAERHRPGGAVLRAGGGAHRCC